MAELIAKKLSIASADKPLVHEADLQLRSGELAVLLGPNGAGKTSLIRGLLGLASLSGGNVQLDGVDVGDLTATQRARSVSYLPQSRPMAWPNRVRDIVALGRFSHGAALGRLKGRDAEAVDDALAACGLSTLADRRTNTLSGGELARVHCARAFATQAALLIADEPVAAVDPRHQFQILDLISAYVRQGGGALVVLHDLNLAARYATRLIWMKDSRIVADGKPNETLTASRIRSIYGVQARVDGGGVTLNGTD
ncbi:MAG: ABC transporter ATP-binding protein [Pseudomonadota bacterium]